MAIRNIRVVEDEVLRKRAREITTIDDKIKELASDMIETMNAAQGVGIAAPQVGVLKRIVIVHPYVDEEPMVMINPVITESSGEQYGYEGCLSIPGRQGIVKRPMFLKCEYTDLDGNVIELETEEFEARVICHELDHLDGKLYTDIEISKEELEKLGISLEEKKSKR